MTTETRLHDDSPAAPGDRVSVAVLDDGDVAVRAAAVDGGAVLTFTAAEWRAFVAGVKNCEFDVSVLG